MQLHIDEAATLDARYEDMALVDGLRREQQPHRLVAQPLSQHLETVGADLIPQHERDLIGGVEIGIDCAV